MTTVYFDYTNLDQVARELGLGVKTIEKIAQETVNRAVDRGKTRAARRYFEAIKQPYADALSRINTSKVSFQHGVHEGVISANKKGRRLSAFDHYAQGPREGVTVAVGRGSGYKTIEPAFLFKSKTGVPLIGFRRPGSQRYNALYGPSPSQVFGTDRPVIGGELDDFMLVEMNRRLQVELGKYNQAKS